MLRKKIVPLRILGAIKRVKKNWKIKKMLNTHIHLLLFSLIISTSVNYVSYYVNYINCVAVNYDF